MILRARKSRTSSAQQHVRHFFRLSTPDRDLPDRWHAYERGDGDGVPIKFDLYWIPLAQAHVVAAGQTAFVGRMFD